MYVGPENLLVAARVDLQDDLPAGEVERVSDAIDRDVRNIGPVTQFFLDATPGSDRQSRVGSRG